MQPPIIYKTTIPVEQHDTCIDVCFAPSIKDAAKALDIEKEMDEEDYGNLAFTVSFTDKETGIERYCCLFTHTESVDKLFDCFTHEAFHLTMYVLIDCGIKPTLYNHEAHAYFNEFINRKLRQIQKEYEVYYKNEVAKLK